MFAPLEGELSEGLRGGQRTELWQAQSDRSMVISFRRSVRKIKACAQSLLQTKSRPLASAGLCDGKTKAYLISTVRDRASSLIT